MAVPRTYTDALGRQHRRSDVEVVDAYLTGYVDVYSGGAIEHMRAELDNLRRGTAELLLALNADAVLNICEEK